jgi:hypothetical protein
VDNAVLEGMSSKENRRIERVAADGADKADKEKVDNAVADNAVADKVVADKVVADKMEVQTDKRNSQDRT